MASAARPRLRTSARPPAPELADGGRPWWPVVAACLGLATLSLLAPSEPTYDPTAWLVWGREIAHGSLDTINGPSWKPLPVIFTTPFSLLGDAVAPALWLVVARAGGLLGIAMGYRLAARLVGPVAGVFAALAITASEGFVFNAFRGNSEGLLVGLVLWGVERHLDGHRTSAFVLGLTAALLRPELWPLWGLYGLWLAWIEPRHRALVLGAFALVPVAWFVPEWIGSGDALRAAARARNPNLSSVAFAAFPAAESLRRSLALIPPVVAGGAVGELAVAWRCRERLPPALAGAAAALLLVVAAMTQARFSGNLRYVVLPLAFVAIVGGAGWARALRFAGARAGAGGVAVVAALLVAGVGLSALRSAGHLGFQARTARSEASLVSDLPRAIERAGGPRAFARCGPVYASRLQVPSVAWELHRRLEDVEIFALPPGSTLGKRGSRLAADPRFAHVATTDDWSVARACK